MRTNLRNYLLFISLLITAAYSEAQKRPEYHRMGSTVSVILEDRDTFWAANVGDSPIYLFDHGNLILVSEEHSVEAEQKNLGFFNASSSTNPTIKNMLTRVMGLNESVDVHITPLKPALDDIVVICSDGLTNYLSETAIKTILDDYTLSLDRKTELLIDEANLGGGGDNVTVILIQIKEEQGKWKRFTRRLLGNEE